MYVIRNEMRHVPRLSIRGEREVQTFEFILCRNCLITQLVKNNHPSQCNRWGNIKQPNKKSSCSAQKKPIINTVEIIHAKAKLIPGITPLLREGGGGEMKKKTQTQTIKKCAWASVSAAHGIPKDRLKLCPGQRWPPNLWGPQPCSITPLSPSCTPGMAWATGPMDGKGRLEPSTHPLSRTPGDTTVGRIRVATSQHHRAPPQLREPPASPEGSQLNQRQLLGLQSSSECPQAAGGVSRGLGSVLLLLSAWYG